jgi:outer membrane protein TolC
VAAAELVRVEEARLRRQRDQLRFVRNQVEVGRATRSDVLRSEVELNNARLGLLQAENDARDATFRLSAAVGVEARVAPAPGASLEAPALERDRDELVRAALEAAPALERARARTRAARSDVESARSTYLPNLTLSGGWAWQNSEYPPANRSWSVSLSGQYPLFNGFRRETQLFRAETQVRLAEAQERATELGIRADVDAAYSTVEAARAGIRLAERSVELTREDLQVTRERFRLGLATILDLQTAQINLQEAEADLVRRRYDLRAGIARLESLLGTDLTGGGTAP